MNRYIIRLLLGVTFVAAAFVAILAYTSQGVNSWATIAAALAVITSVISSWSAQKIFEQQDDNQKPYVFPTIDNTSRVGLLLFRVKNYGGSPAYDIYIDWQIPLLNLQNNVIKFNQYNDEDPEISVLLPQESLAILIDSQPGFFQKHKDSMNYTGTIRFKNVSGKNFKYPFRVNAGQIAKTVANDSEEPEGFRKLQDIPDSIDNLTKEVLSLRQFIQSKSLNDSNSP